MQTISRFSPEPCLLNCDECHYDGIAFTVRDLSPGILTLIECSSSVMTSSISETVILPSTITSNIPTMKDRKSTRLNSSHVRISYAVFCLKKKKPRPTFYTEGSTGTPSGLGSK